MAHQNPQHKDTTILWARNILATKDKYLILDTETTGLKKSDVILQIGLIDLDGNTLLNTLIKPTKRKRISSEATEVHGITISDLQKAPTFAEVKPQLENLIKGKTILIYNAEYDERLIDQTCNQDDCGYIKMRTECIMIHNTQDLSVNGQIVILIMLFKDFLIEIIPQLVIVKQPYQLSKKWQ